jgi:methionyl-tRNA formyltransferase
VVRAFAPDPAAFTTLDGNTLKVWRAAVDPREGPPGRVMAAGGDGLVVACGAGALRLLEVQLQGGRRMPIGAFLAGHKVPAGTTLGT